MRYPETCGWMVALTYPSRVEIHSWYTGTSCWRTGAICTLGGGGAAAETLLVPHPWVAKTRSASKATRDQFSRQDLLFLWLAFPASSEHAQKKRVFVGMAIPSSFLTVD